MGIIPQKLIDKGRWWTKAWSLVEGCSPVSESCSNCWLKAMHKRFKPDAPFEHVHIREDRLDIPRKTRKPQAFAVWSDLYHESVQFEFIEQAYDVMLESGKHTYLILTKRPERLYEFYDAHRDALQFSDMLNSIWHGTTVETQEQADKRIPELLKIPGNKFLSVEPILEGIDILPYLCSHQGWLHHGVMCPLSFYSDPCSDFKKCSYRQISQVICGSESGIKRRATKIEWVENLVMQCDRAGVPIFIKQLSINEMVSKDMSEWPINLRRRDLVWGI